MEAELISAASRLEGHARATITADCNSAAQMLRARPDLKGDRLRTQRPISTIKVCVAIVIAVGVPGFAATAALADRIENTVAIFSALDKVTARISKFEVALGETKTFGPLKVTPRACYSRPPTEQPKTTTFVEVDEKQLDGKEKRIFTGWMFAESPGLYGVEHPTLDVWLTECQKPLHATAQKAPDAVPVKGADGKEISAPPAAAASPPPETTRRRVRR